MTLDGGLRVAESFQMDLLSERTHRDRRYLLATSAAVLAIATTGALPTKISALGIEFSIPNQQSMLWGLGLLVFYFLTAFAISGVADFYRWNNNQSIAKVAQVQEQMRLQEERMQRSEPSSATLLERLDPVQRAIELDRRRKQLRDYIAANESILPGHRAAIWVRVIFDLVVPVAISIAAISALWLANPSK